MSNTQLPEDQKKYPIDGYAPGDYFGKCHTCGKEFLGDKRAFQCEPCAIKDKEFYDSLTPEGQKRFDNRFTEIANQFFENRRLEEQNNLLRDAISSNDTIIEGLEKSIKLKEEENMRLRGAMENLNTALDNFFNTPRCTTMPIPEKYIKLINTAQRKSAEALKLQP